jgi:hypothetical protein
MAHRPIPAPDNVLQNVNDVGSKSRLPHVRHFSHWPDLKSQTHRGRLRAERRWRSTLQCCTPSCRTTLRSSEDVGRGACSVVDEALRGGWLSNDRLSHCASLAGGTEQWTTPQRGQEGRGHGRSVEGISTSVQDSGATTDEACLARSLVGMPGVC